MLETTTRCHRIKFHAVVLAFVLSALSAVGGVVEDYAANLSPLIDPAKLATLGERGANPRVQKAVYWLATGRTNKAAPAKVVDGALRSVVITNKAAADLTKAALLRNLTIADRLGCLDAAGLTEMRKGDAATVRRGPYVGDQLSVDHIIPRAIVPDLDNVIANLELLPLIVNEHKGAKIGRRQRSLAVELNKARLLSDAGLRAVLGHR